jgi:hypothetical protein
MCVFMYMYVCVCTMYVCRNVCLCVCVWEREGRLGRCLYSRFRVHRCHFTNFLIPVIFISILLDNFRKKKELISRTLSACSVFQSLKALYAKTHSKTALYFRSIFLNKKFCTAVTMGGNDNISLTLYSLTVGLRNYQVLQQNSALCPHVVFTCSVWYLAKTEFVDLYRIQRFVFLKAEHVLSSRQGLAT